MNTFLIVKINVMQVKLFFCYIGFLFDDHRLEVRVQLN